MKRAKILSASAGSGKTYQLTLKYMCDVILHPERYRNILAVTFTNKATEEMKSRILREIHTLASGKNSPYLSDVKRELGLTDEQIREGAKRARTRILHDFSRFTILTIDRFFQRILRAFIKELSLDLNYNIELDTTLLLERSTDALVESIAGDEQLRKWLLEFAEERINDGTRWDMRSDLKSLGSELFKENGAKRIDPQLSKKVLLDTVNSVIAEGEKYRTQLKELGTQAISVMRKYGVTPEQFKGTSRSFAFCFEKYAEGELKPPTATMRKVAEELSEWYTKSASGTVITASAVLKPILEDICKCYDEGIKRINTAKLVRENYRSFALLADLRERVNDICNQENIMVLSKTKDILSDFIDDSNAPFIYEKVGSRYDHYMIDEFQDTSVREWRNMLPLLREALSSNPEASVFIVGDIKQSIYRWRGGDWRLLNNDAIEDLGRENTIVEPLKKNYRSLPNVVKFNNGLISKVVAKDNDFLNTSLIDAQSSNKIKPSTKESLYDIMLNAYSDYEQIPAKEGESGYAKVVAFDSSAMNSPFIDAIESAIKRGYHYGDILILVRGNTDAKKVADALFAYKQEKFTSKNLPGFNILTPATLTLESCDIVEFSISVMLLALDPSNDIERGVYNRYQGLPLDRTFSDEEKLWLNQTAHLSPLEAFENIVSRFELHKRKESIAFLQAMHEQILAFSSQRVVDIQYYLKWWEERGKQEAITVEMTDDTIEITTIHKSKGLERPIVIIPYSRWDMSPRASLHPIVWAKANDDTTTTTTIGDFPIVYGSTMENSDFSEEYYKELVMSHVDGINLLYVAITRASRELYMYVPTSLSSNSKSGENINTTAPLIIDAAKAICSTPEIIQNDGKDIAHIYTYGEPTQCESNKVGQNNNDILLEEYISHKPTIKVRYPSHRCIEEGIINSSKAMSDGIRLHRLFERAITEQDLRNAVKRMSLDCLIDAEQAEALNTKVSDILTDSRVKEWFSNDWESVKCESAIIADGDIRRPDRVMIANERVVIVDYKFGDKHSASYRKQIAEYMQLIARMGKYKQIEGYVWYISLGEIESVEI
ncbi:MAG: UvrD-helicase domain-containing protein [Alistipes sp.]|nr:UvrD-helicase domain-containing protein [Alistipes sp.]